jgi:4-oxalomesaconate hydratase
VTQAPPQIVIVGAHAADFVWRASGTAAIHVEAGGRATVVALSYGERGESGDLWAQDGQTVEQVKRIRSQEATRAARAIGAELVALDLGDYPLEISSGALQKLVELLVTLAPRVIVTHTETDPFNPDHPVAHAAVRKARLLAMGAGGVPAAFPTIRPPALFAFEPHQPEACGFVPDTLVDVTETWPHKELAMRAMSSQSYLAEHYEQRGRQRATQARYAGGTAATRYVEAFQRLTPELRGCL